MLASGVLGMACDFMHDTGSKLLCARLRVLPRIPQPRRSQIDDDALLPRPKGQICVTMARSVAHSRGNTRFRKDSRRMAKS